MARDSKIEVRPPKNNAGKLKDFCARLVLHKLHLGFFLLGQYREVQRPAKLIDINSTAYRVRSTIRLTYNE
ncbi:hypothetical protein SAMN05216573_102482 [Bradyrhizobium sp. Rc3b]|nr:hypothetical protein [Bradyrhizobium sp. SBR1B]SFM55470.1 hypothetical protein SAMN05216573_102482 [Bradyrhizobium sp. Rc3b]